MYASRRHCRVMMYGLRSGRLSGASVDSNSVDPTTSRGLEPSSSPRPNVLPSNVSVKTEPVTLPITQSPYFPLTHGPFVSSSNAGHTLPSGGGGLEEEEFDFDAGYVISSKLSQMVANGAYSYPHPSTHGSPHPLVTAGHDHPHIRPDYEPLQSIHTGLVKVEPGLTPPLTTPTRTLHTDALSLVKVKSEPGVSATADGCHHGNTALPIKPECGNIPPPCTHSAPAHISNISHTPTLPTVRVKTEPGVTPPQTTPTIQVKREPEPGCEGAEVKCEDVEDVWEPPRWREQYRNICQMRSERTAPVDTHGCFMLAERDVPPHVRRYQVLVSLMLSSQTKDQITGKAMTNLKRHGLTVDNILTTPREDIAKMINAVGFWQKKSDYIKRTTETLASKYNGDIPNTLKELMALPGVGPKMANLVMDFAWGQVTGIAVDTHVHRIAHRLGWMRKQTPTPEATRVALEKWLPMSEWSNLNLMLVGFGQTLCSPQRPHCEECLNRNLCPSSLACSDATMGGLAGTFSPNALTTGKKKKGKTATPTKGEPEGNSPLVGSSSAPSRKRRKLKSKDVD